MNDPVSHDALERAYGPFQRDHDRRRQDLLVAISRSDVSQQPPVARAGRRRVLGVALSLAAVLLVGVTLGVTLWPSAVSPAAAIEGVRERLLGVRSLHLKGWIYQTVENDGRISVERFPFEFYAERPCRYWHDAYGFSFEGNHTLKEVTHTYTASDGERAIWVSHDQRFARLMPASLLQTQLETERALQAKVFDRLVAGLPEAYEHVGSEEVQGVKCQVYEQREPQRDGHGNRRRLWIDAATGAPLRMMAWIIRPTGLEEPRYEYDMIDINGPRPGKLFTFEPPAGYQLTRAEGEVPPLTLPDGAVSSGGGVSLGAWIPFNVDDRGIVVCWWVEPFGNHAGAPPTPRFALGLPGAELPCRRIELRKDSRWTWSLLLPQQDQAQISLDDQLSIELKGERAHLETTNRPLLLSPEQLQRVLLEAQKSTISPGSGVEPFTLEDIREQIRSVSPNE